MFYIYLPQNQNKRWNTSHVPDSRKRFLCFLSLTGWSENIIDMGSKFFISFLILFIALFLQIAIGDIFNLWPGLVLAVLLAGCYFLNFAEVMANVLFAVFVLNWQPSFSPEIIIFSLIPIAAYVLKTFVQFKPLPGILFFILSATFIFYLIFSPKFFFIHPGVFILDLSVSLVYGLITFMVLRRSYL